MNSSEKRALVAKIEAVTSAAAPGLPCPYCNRPAAVVDFVGQLDSPAIEVTVLRCTACPGRWITGKEIKS